MTDMRDVVDAINTLSDRLTNVLAETQEDRRERFVLQVMGSLMGAEFVGDITPAELALLSINIADALLSELDA